MNDQFHEERLTGIGGSDAAAIVGRSPFRNIFDVWDEKCRFSKPQPPSERQKTGLWLEPLIRDRFKTENPTDGNLDVIDAGKFFRSPDHQHMICHVDGIVTKNGGAVFEAKTTDGRFAYLWGESGSDHVPDVYNIQCQHNMAVTGLREAFLAVLIGGSDWRTFRIPFNSDIVKALIEKEAWFWNDHVLPIKPPPVDGSEQCSKALQRQFPEVVTPEVPQSEAFQYFIVAERWLHWRKLQKQAEEQVKLAANELKEKIGDRRRLVTPDGAFSWSPVSRPKTDWKAIQAEIGIEQAMIDKHTSNTEYRMFRGPKIKGEE